MAQERHNEQGKKGFHYHVGVLNKNASKKNYQKVVRRAFPEFEGRTLYVQSHRPWGSVCKYVTKEDKKPLLWGHTLEDVAKIIKQFEQKKGIPKDDKEKHILEKVKDSTDWFSVYQDEIVAKACLTSYNAVRSVFADLEIVLKMGRSVEDRLKKDLEEHGNPRKMI